MHHSKHFEIQESTCQIRFRKSKENKNINVLIQLLICCSQEEDSTVDSKIGKLTKRDLWISKGIKMDIFLSKWVKSPSMQRYLSISKTTSFKFNPV